MFVFFKIVLMDCFHKTIWGPAQILNGSNSSVPTFRGTDKLASSWGGKCCDLSRIFSQRSYVYSFQETGCLCSVIWSAATLQGWKLHLLFCSVSPFRVFRVLWSYNGNLLPSSSSVSALQLSCEGLCWPQWTMSDLSVQPNAFPVLNSNWPHPSDLYTVKIGVDVSPVAPVVNTGNSVPLSSSTLVLSTLCRFLIFVCKRSHWFF